MIAIVSLLFSFTSQVVDGSAGEWATPNVLLVVADDLGVDMLAAYGEGQDLPVTPTLDGLAATGVLFRNAWSNPNCSPTRATVLTGRYGFRTGIGDVVTLTSAALSTSEVTIPELLETFGAGYATAAIGKWHLSNESNGGRRAPNLAGFEHFDGFLGGALLAPPSGTSYYGWTRTVNGVQSWETTYATTANVDAALSWIDAQDGRWLCYLSFNAPHLPYHQPPPGLYSEDLTGLTPSTSLRPFYKAAIEAIDAELGRLLDGLGAETRANTTVVFLGDNGTPPAVTVAPFLGAHAKPTVYEGGVNVPLIVSGASVSAAGAECTALVSAVDLFATVAEVAGLDPAALLPGVTLDSLSLVPYLDEPARQSLRSSVYTERFRPVGATGPVKRAHRAIRNDTFKLIATMEGYQFYDLTTDPFELTNLYPGAMTPTTWTYFDALLLEMNTLVNSH